MYSGIILDWDYANQTVHLSMPEYVKEALVRFAHRLRKPLTNHTRILSQCISGRYNMQTKKTAAQNLTKSAPNLHSN